MSSSLDGPLADSHCHLCAPEFELDLDAVIQRASEKGVRLIINIGFDPPSWDRALRTAEQYPWIPCSIGLHPHESNQFSSKLAAQIAELAKDPRVVAIGETGLDYYRKVATVEAQLSAFRWHLSLAAELGKPVVIHNRNADTDIATEVARYAGAVVPVLHCYSSTDKGFLDTMLSMGAIVSFAGNITYRSADQLRDIARLVPETRLLVETDAPYLAPQPWRGTRNEPAYLSETVTVLAEATRRDPQHLSRIITQNAERVFNRTA